MLDQARAITAGPVRQIHDFKSGNEAAALAARDIGFHVMGYFPITPSTEVAESLSKMQANGEHDIVMIPADGEHGAAGICYGAALGGGRLLPDPPPPGCRDPGPSAPARRAQATDGRRPRGPRRRRR